MLFTVYILYSKLQDVFYIGSTSMELIERLRRHKTNHKGYTGKVSDWQVVYSEQFSNKPEALKREKEIKNKKSRKYIEWLISSAGSGHPSLAPGGS